jgi:hypothetical protein
MPKFAELSTYAGAIAPVIGAVHVNVHAAARAVGRELSGAPDPSPGFLNDLRFTLPLRPLTRAALAAVYRYGTADERESIIQEHLEQGALTEDPDGLLHATAHGLEIIHSLYGLHAAAVERIWPDHDVPALATLARSVLTQAQQDLPTTAHPSGHSAEAVGGAFAVVVPPYEPSDAPPGVLLFNRLAALRYHRADAHAAAWQEAGLSVADIVALKRGPVRERIEARTNQRAARPYRILTEAERARLYDGLLRLV